MNTTYEKTLLTIAIPTYNRADCLDLCLSQICKQLKGFEASVELIVSNNCSTDATDDIVRNYVDRGIEIRYIKNSENIGADGNICQCFTMATGKYVLVFADDDVLLDGALENILRVLDGDYGVIHLKSYSFLNDYLTERPREPSGCYLTYDDKRLFIDKVDIMLTFISGTIVNKSLVDPDLNFDEFKSTNLVQLSWTLSALLNARQNLFIDSFLLAAKAENTGGYRLCTVFGVNLNKIFAAFVQRGADPGYFEIINIKILRSFFPNYILTMRKNAGSFHHEDYYHTLYPVFKAYPSFWLVTWPAIRLPLMLAKLWYKICKKFIKIFKLN